MAINPNPDRITADSWWFMEQLLQLAPGTQNGGIYANKAGYHNARSNLLASPQWSNDYSIRLPADKRGPNNFAAGYDWTFPEAQQGDYRRIMLYGRRIKAAFDARDPRLAGWREVLVQADPDSSAEGYDFVSWSTRTPDSSHLWHMHLSELREFVTDRANKEAMLSILRGEDVAITTADADLIISRLLATMLGKSGPIVGVAWQDAYRYSKATAADVDLDPDELLAIGAVVRQSVPTADEIAAAVVAKLPEGTLTQADVEAAVRAVFADAGTP